MYLFEDQQTFRDFIVDTSERFKVREEIVEKDYFVSIVLKALSQKNPNIIFKGGTSLSKAYQIIDRFSEDIDLSYYIPTHSTPNNKSRKRLKDDILNALKDFGFEVTNETEIFSRRSFNKYLVNYSPLYNDGSGLKQELWVETYCHNSSFPVTKKSISNYIYQYLKEKNLSEAINDFPEIIPFSMNVQSLERTFVDKLFAIGDKYMNEMPERNSRHLYDLFFLWDRGGIEKNQLRETFEEVRLILAKDLEHNPSSAASVNFQTLLIDLLNTDFFQLDYERNTSFLSTEVPNYNDMKVSLLKTINELDFL